MTKICYRLWYLKSGIYKLLISKKKISKRISTSKNIDIILDNLKKVTEEDKKHLLQIISQIKNVERNNKIELLEIVNLFNDTFSEIEEKTPLILFKSDPDLFFESFWDFTRKSIGREYYVLRFESPLMVKLDFVYELDISPDNKLEQSMIYLGCLSDRIPILNATVNDSYVTIVPYEVLVNRIKNIIEDCDDWKLIKLQIKYEDSDLENLIRTILTVSKPVFIEFISDKYKKENFVIVTLTARGTLLEYKTEINFKKEKRSLFSLYKKIIRVFKVIFGLSLKEPEVSLQIFPKSPQASHWTYIYAPEKYHLERLESETRNPENVLEDNSPNNPHLLSYRLGRTEQMQAVCPLDLNFNVKVPKMDNRWLGLINALLLIFSSIWLLAILSFFFTKIPVISTILYFIRTVVSYPEVFQSTFLLIGFIILARSWFFHESTVFKGTSIRFAILLIVLTLLCIGFAIIRAVFS